MTVSSFLALLPALMGLAAVQVPGGDPGLRRLVAQDRVIVRVPVRPRLVPPRIEWHERKGPKCIPLADVRSAMLSGAEQVDFLLKNRQRIRAELSEGCEALDFYGGFYLKTRDERICADRDTVHSRMGGSCQIDRFRKLEPRVAR